MSLIPVLETQQARCTSPAQRACCVAPAVDSNHAARRGVTPRNGTRQEPQAGDRACPSFSPAERPGATQLCTRQTRTPSVPVAPQPRGDSNPLAHKAFCGQSPETRSVRAAVPGGALLSAARHMPAGHLRDARPVPPPGVEPGSPNPRRALNLSCGGLAPASFPCSQARCADHADDSA